MSSDPQLCISQMLAEKKILIHSDILSFISDGIPSRQSLLCRFDALRARSLFIVPLAVLL